MFSSFRQSMSWLHTWFGLVLGFVLIVVFFFGTLSVFDREFDRWALPETRFAPQPMPSFDTLLLPILQQVEPDAQEYAQKMPVLHDASKGPATPRLNLPADEYWAYTTHRDPVLRMGVGFVVPQPKDPDGHNHIHGNVTIDPRTGALMRDDQLKIGSEWFYPLHYSLHLDWKRLGYWIVGLAALIMLVALITGIVIHRKLFLEFFTFRPWKRTQRSTLDVHNLTGVAALPFHFFFAFTGLVIFAGIYLPVGDTLLQPLHLQHDAQEALHTGLPHKPAGTPAPLASVDAMMQEAQRRWAARDMAGDVGFLKVHHVGDANSYVSIYRAGSDRVALVGEGIHFKASTGEVVYVDPPRTVVAELNEFLTGLHLQHFEHWLLRWLYVVGGLLGCVCIATGFIFFVGKRKRQHAEAGFYGSRAIEALAVATVTGTLIATIGMLVANRVLPADLAGKGDWEKILFGSLWALALAHAFWRSALTAPTRMNPAWRAQCLAIAGLAVAAVLLNWATTGDHLIKTLFTAPYWPVAGVDLSLLATALLAALAARTLARRKQTVLADAAQARDASGPGLAATAKVTSHG